jgi:hypothetical protein
MVRLVGISVACYAVRDSSSIIACTTKSVLSTRPSSVKRHPGGFMWIQDTASVILEGTQIVHGEGGMGVNAISFRIV